MKNQGLVSVIMNCYNGEKYLREAVQSVLDQTYPYWEIIFWDNQSDDASANLFSSYTDSRMHYFRAPQHTSLLYEARGYALLQARGDYIAFLDVDDIWLPEKLEKQVALFQNPAVGIVCGNYWVHSEPKNKRWIASKKPMPTGWVLEALFKSYFVALPTLIVRRTSIKKLEYVFDPRFHIIGDRDLVHRLSAVTKLDCVQEPVAIYRLHGNNETSKHAARNIQELEIWIKEIKNIEKIGKNRYFGLAQEQITYIKAMQFILQRKKKMAIGLLRDISTVKDWLRILIALLLPQFLVKKLKN